MPENTKNLTKEIAMPTLTGVRTLWYNSVANGLTPEALADIIALVDQNDNQNYLTLAEEMEERDLHYSSVLRTRKLAVSGMDISIESYSDDESDIEKADFARDIVNDKKFKGLMSDQLDGLGKSYSVNEIIWDRSEELWIPDKYIWRDPRYFMFHPENGTELRLVDEEDMYLGLPLERYKFSVHYPKLKTGLPIRGGLARLAVVAYMCKSYTMKDWMAFAEVFGMPLRVGKHGMDASDDQKAALLNAVASIGTDAAAIIPDNMLIEFIESAKAVGGERLFEGLANWLDAQVSKGVLGQTATTEGTPGKLGSDDAQTEVRDDIRSPVDRRRVL